MFAYYQSADGHHNLIIGDVCKKAGEVWGMLEDILPIFAWKSGGQHT